MGSKPSLIINFGHLKAVSVSAKQLKDTVVGTDEESGACPKADLFVSLDCLSLIMHPLPSLVNCLNLPLGT